MQDIRDENTRKKT